MVVCEGIHGVMVQTRAIGIRRWVLGPLVGRNLVLIEVEGMVAIMLVLRSVLFQITMSLSFLS
jgi:hypothetical protein